MADIGIQVWQGTLPENDIPALQRRLKGRLVLMGGMGAAIDRADATPEEITAYAEKTLRDCCPGGHFIPSITYGLPGAVYPHVDQYIDQAIDRVQRRAAHAPFRRCPRSPAASWTLPARPRRPAGRDRGGGGRYSDQDRRGHKAGAAEKAADPY